jgi:uncharacterized UPF0160 family protein
MVYCNKDKQSKKRKVPASAEGIIYKWFNQKSRAASRTAVTDDGFPVLGFTKLKKVDMSAKINSGVIQ